MSKSTSPGGRPRVLSPHIEIWGWTVTMAASISHRATGIALYAGTILLAIWFGAAAAGPQIFAKAAAIVGSPFGLVVLFGFTWALLFHLMNGLRHLYWDSGRGLAPKTAKMTSWLVFGASITLAIILFLTGLSAGGNI